VANVQDFQAMMSAHSDWIHNAEQTVTSFKHPSKLVERVLQQINEHKVPSYSTHCCSAAFLLDCDATSTELKISSFILLVLKKTLPHFDIAIAVFIHVVAVSHNLQLRPEKQQTQQQCIATGMLNAFIQTQNNSLKGF